MIPAPTSASLPASAGLVNPWLHLYVCRHMAQADRKQKRPRVMTLNRAIETLVFWFQNLGLSGLLYGLQLVPYRWRVPAAGWVVTRLVAPLAGYTDLPFRLLCRSFGAGYCVSEMISCHGLVYRQANTLRMLASIAEEKPVAFQLFGADPEAMAAVITIIRQLEGAGELVMIKDEE